MAEAMGYTEFCDLMRRAGKWPMKKREVFEEARRAGVREGYASGYGYAANEIAGLQAQVERLNDHIRHWERQAENENTMAPAVPGETFLFIQKVGNALNDDNRREAIHWLGELHRRLLNAAPEPSKRCPYPDCGCPIDKTTVCAKGLPQ